MSKEVNSLRLAQARVFGKNASLTRQILGAERMTRDEKNLSTILLRSEKTRALVAFFLPNTNHLSQRERLGVLYMTALILAGDDAIDEGGLKNAAPGSRREDLLVHTIPGSNITLDTLQQRSLACFQGNDEKYNALESFYNSILKVHDTLVPEKAGEYSTERVRQYRKDTNDQWARTYAILLGKPEKEEAFKQFFNIIQFKDDAEDWPKDMNEGTLNLYVAIATEIANRREDPHPEELARLQKYAETPENERENRIEFMRENTPLTRQAYLQELDDPTLRRHVSRLLLWRAGKQI